MVLKDITVLEFAGLAPAPYCGLILRDFGANVIRVDRISAGTMDVLSRGKRSISLNLKSKQIQQLLLHNIIPQIDILIDPYRPGIMESLGLGPETVLLVNPRCIYVRITGFGQSGDYCKMAGHDINYIAISGALSTFGRAGSNPVAPGNVLGDFAGGALGVLLALYERTKSGKGQVIDAAMIDGAAYLSTFIYKMKQAQMWNEPRGMNVLDSGAPFYDTYKTKDEKFMAVGAIESNFYAILIDILGLAQVDDMPQQMDTSRWPELRAIIGERFASKTQNEWRKLFDGMDACVTPVLDIDEVGSLPHNQQRELLLQGNQPRAAPRLSRSPAKESLREPEVGQDTIEILLEFGIDRALLDDMHKRGDLYQMETREISKL